MFKVRVIENFLSLIPVCHHPSFVTNSEDCAGTRGQCDHWFSFFTYLNGVGCNGGLPVGIWKGFRSGLGIFSR